MRRQSLRRRELAGSSAGAVQTAGAAANPLLELADRNLQAAYAGGERLEAVLRRADGAGDYPRFQLASHLAAVVQLIRAELGIRIFFVELGGGGIGGFDNHANQRDNHAALLRQMSLSIAAFVNDLQRAEVLDRVVLMTFSEFGRTLVENGRRGTDHGDAAPVFLFGGRLRGGLVGSHPRLDQLAEGAPSPTPTCAACMPPCSTAGWAWTARPSWAGDTNRWTCSRERCVSWAWCLVTALPRLVRPRCHRFIVGAGP